MDEIQKVLIKAGRKDLAQKYYEKVAFTVKSPEGSRILKKQDELFEVMDYVCDEKKFTLQDREMPDMKIINAKSKAQKEIELALAPLLKIFEN